LPSLRPNSRHGRNLKLYRICRIIGNYYGSTGIPKVLLKGCTCIWAEWTRGRLFLILVHADAGGQQTADNILTTMKILEAQAVSKLKLWDDILILDDPSLIEARIKAREATLRNSRDHLT